MSNETTLQSTSYLVRVHYRRQPGETPNYMRDVRHFNCRDVASAVGQMARCARQPNVSQVELFALLESVKLS